MVVQKKSQSLLTKHASLVSPLLTASPQKKSFFVVYPFGKELKQGLQCGLKRGQHRYYQPLIALYDITKGIALTACASTHSLQSVVENLNLA